MEPHELRQLFRELIDAVKPKVPGRYLGQSYRAPRTISFLTNEIAAAGTAASAITPVHMGGVRLTLLMSSHQAAAVEVCFDDAPGNDASPTGASGASSGWFPLVPGSSVQLPPETPFRQFRIRLQNGVTGDATTRAVFGVDVDTDGQTRELGRFAQVTGGAIEALFKAIRFSDGQQGAVEGADGSAGRVVPAIAGWTGAAYARIAATAAGRLLVNLIAGQDGVDGNAGAAGATTLRTVTASDSPDVASLAAIEVDADAIRVAAQAIETDTGSIATNAATIAGWDDGAGRGDVNPIAGQSGVAGGVGDPSASTVRVVGASTPTGVGSQFTTAGAGAADAAAANANRKGLLIRNRNTTAGDGIYVQVGADADATAFLLPPDREMVVTARGRVSVMRQGANNVTLDLYEESNA